jgi:hypothetical protein
MQEKILKFNNEGFKPRFGVNLCELANCTIGRLKMAFASLDFAEGVVYILPLETGAWNELKSLQISRKFII